MARPNVIFMHSHNTGRFIQPYGHAVPTPNIMRLAREGVLFRRAFSAAPTCSPSRGSFMTGRWPHCHGLIGLGHRGWGLDDPTQHIVHTFRNAGYHTTLIGVEHTGAHLRGTHEDVGYDEAFETDAAAAKTVGPAAEDFLRREHDTPFFVSIGLKETHIPYHDPDPEHHPAEDPRYCRPCPRLPDVPELRREMAGFKASARIMDECYGRVLDALDETGLSDNTLVFCFSDHGIQLPYGIANLYEMGIGVYCLARGPAGSELRGGGCIDALVSLIDIFPTVCDVTGIEPPSHLQGKSLLPLVRGDVDRLHEEVYAEQNYHAAYEPTRCVRTERYKYIRRYDERENLVLPNADTTAAKEYLLEHGWRDQPRDQEMLFDLVFDPNEHNNLVGSSDYAEVLADMRRRLDEWMKATDDPILQGPIPAPEGAKLNDPDQSSPNDPTHTV